MDPHSVGVEDDMDRLPAQVHEQESITPSTESPAQGAKASEEAGRGKVPVPHARENIGLFVVMKGGM